MTKEIIISEEEAVAMLDFITEHATWNDMTRRVYRDVAMDCTETSYCRIYLLYVKLSKQLGETNDRLARFPFKEDEA